MRTDDSGPISTNIECFGKFQEFGAQVVSAANE